MAKLKYSTQGKNVLLDGKVVSTAADDAQAITMAQSAAKKTGNTYVPIVATKATVTPAKTTVTDPNKQRQIDNQLAIEKNAGIVKGAAPVVTPAPATTPVITPAATTIPGLNTNGLAEADARRRAGKASATDLKNLQYAESKGWVPATVSKAEPAQVTPSSLNTVGLAEANIRRRNGTATPTDIANLEYAEGKGWTPGNTGAAPAATTTPTAPSGVTPGLNTAGLAEANSRRANGKATPEDLKNLAYAEKNGWVPGSTPFTSVTTPEQANAAINEEQDADIASKSESDAPPVRRTLDTIMEDIKKSVTPDAGEPEAPNFTKQLENYRLEYGLSALETQLDDLRAEEQEILAIRRQRVAAEGNKRVAMNVISGRVSETERQENERLDVVQRAISNATNQLNTKLNIVNTLMDTSQLDYATATQKYDKEMATNISLFNAAQGIEDEFKDDAQREVDNARANAQIIINSMVSKGVTYDTLSDSQKTTISKLGVQSGLGPEFFEAVLNQAVAVNKEILTQIISDDKAYVSIIYKDGTAETIATGSPKSSNTQPTRQTAPVSQEQKAYDKFIDDAAGYIGKLDNGDVSWATAWDTLHLKYPEASSELIDATLGGGYTEEKGWYGRAVAE